MYRELAAHCFLLLLVGTSLLGCGADTPPRPSFVSEPSSIRLKEETASGLVVSISSAEVVENKLRISVALKNESDTSVWKVFIRGKSESFIEDEFGNKSSVESAPSTSVQPGETAVAPRELTAPVKRAETLRLVLVLSVFRADAAFGQGQTIEFKLRKP